MRLALNVPVPLIHFQTNDLARQEMCKDCQVSNENSLGNLLTNLATTDPSKPTLAL